MNETLGISPKPPETILPKTDPNMLSDLESAARNGDHDKLAKLTSDHPRDLFCWAALATITSDTISAYAFSRIGYHRGLDTLRASGWRGSGYARSEHKENRGFLTCLALLRHYAQEINEKDEFERCGEFLSQLDPSYDWNTFDPKNPIDFLFAHDKE